MVYGFARQSHGHAVIDSAPGAGTTVRLWLPEVRCQGPSGDVVAEVDGGTKPATPCRILLVDDEAGVRTLIAEILRDAGYDVTEAKDGVQGLEQIRTDPSIDIVISDVGMPRMNGVDMIKQARVGRPELEVLFITGYAQKSVFLEDQLDHRTYLLTKPFAMDALLQRVADILSAGSQISAKTVYADRKLSHL